MTDNAPVIAVDGPSGVGKGTLCQARRNTSAGIYWIAVPCIV